MLIKIAPGSFEPNIIESFGGPEFFADGGVTRDHGEVIISILYVQRTVGDGIEHREVCRIHFPRSGYYESLQRSAAKWRAWPQH